MIILAIDPGCTDSAFVLYDVDARRPVWFSKLSNEKLLGICREHVSIGDADVRFQHLAVEMIASYGMPVGREVFETCLWIGRFLEAWRGPHSLVYRKDVKLHLCGTFRAKDPHVRQALIDRFGPGKPAAIGTRKQPGPLYGVAADVWSALAVAVTWGECNYEKARSA